MFSVLEIYVGYQYWDNITLGSRGPDDWATFAGRRSNQMTPTLGLAKQCQIGILEPVLFFIVLY